MLKLYRAYVNYFRNRYLVDLSFFPCHLEKNDVPHPFVYTPVIQFLIRYIMPLSFLLQSTLSAVLAFYSNRPSNVEMFMQSKCIVQNLLFTTYYISSILTAC